MIKTPHNEGRYETQDETVIMCGRNDSCEEDAYPYPYKEKRDISALYESHKDHPAIEIPSEAKEIVDVIKSKSKSDKEIIQKIYKWMLINIENDCAHAEASRKNNEGKNKIYMNAEETFKTKTGICGEQSLLMIGMLKHANIHSTIYRPSRPHIAVIAEIKDNNKNIHYFVYDTILKTFYEKKELLTLKTSKDSHYEIGVTDIVNNYKYNWNKRRESGKEFGLKNYGRELTVEELLDVERAHLCEPLKYGTDVGLMEVTKMKAECDRLRQRIRNNNLYGE